MASPLLRHDPFAVLGLEKCESVQAIKAAYRREAKRWHPDKQDPHDPDQRAEATARFQKVQEAYEQILGSVLEKPQRPVQKPACAAPKKGPMPSTCRDTGSAGASTSGRGAASFGERLPHAEQQRAQQVEAQMQQEAEEVMAQSSVLRASPRARTNEKLQDPKAQLQKQCASTTSPNVGEVPSTVPSANDEKMDVPDEYQPNKCAHSTGHMSQSGRPASEEILSSSQNGVPSATFVCLQSDLSGRESRGSGSSFSGPTPKIPLDLAKGDSRDDSRDDSIPAGKMDIKNFSGPSRHETADTCNKPVAGPALSHWQTLFRALLAKDYGSPSERAVSQVSHLQRWLLLVNRLFQHRKEKRLRRARRKHKAALQKLEDDAKKKGPMPSTCRDTGSAGASTSGRGAASFGERLPHAEQQRAQQVEAQMQQEAEEVMAQSSVPRVSHSMRTQKAPVPCSVADILQQRKAQLQQLRCTETTSAATDCIADSTSQPGCPEQQGVSCATFVPLHPDVSGEESRGNGSSFSGPTPKIPWALAKEDSRDDSIPTSGKMDIKSF